jgi:uncharacterized circularly permuted ATP-grasp superfamily protein
MGVSGKEDPEARMQIAAQPRMDSYIPPDGAYDEAFEPDGGVRPHYAPVIAALGATDLDELIRTVEADLFSRGVSFKGADGDAPFRVDPVPRLLTAAEWEDLRAGLVQRVKALNAFLTDAYSDRRIVDAGVMPARVIDSCVHVEPWMKDVVVPHGSFAGAAGLDIIRDEDGEFRVLEDNLRTPSGYTYLAAARDVLDERLPPAAHMETESLHDVVERLGAALEAAAPDGIEEPSVVILSDGPENTAWYEHLTIAHRLDIPVVQLGDLRSRYGRLYAWTGRRDIAVDVIYRRTDNDRLMDDDGRPTPLADALLGPMRAGRLAMFNAFGTGVADDKLAHAYVEEMVRFYLGEEPLLKSVETFDLGKPEMLSDALDRIEDMVIKQRTGSGGFGVTIYSHASADERAAVDQALKERPQDFIAQRRVTLSTHPTAIGGRLVPRHVDLRPFCLSRGDDVDVLPGGLTRVQFNEGVLVVNSSQDGGGKDTWVLT